MKKIFIVILLLFLVLPLFFRSLRVNFITGGDHLLSSSETKKEAIKRDVYVCNVYLSENSGLFNDSSRLEVYDGWMEKSWRSGYLFWTTIPDGGFEIRLKGKFSNNENDITLINPKSNISLNYYNGEFYCRLNFMPNSDSLTFNSYKKYNKNKPDSNIIGNITLILEGKSGK